MHSHNYGGTRMHHNGDYSGQIQFWTKSNTDESNVLVKVDFTKLAVPALTADAEQMITFTAVPLGRLDQPLGDAEEFEIRAGDIHEVIAARKQSDLICAAEAMSTEQLLAAVTDDDIQTWRQAED